MPLDITVTIDGTNAGKKDQEGMKARIEDWNSRLEEGEDPLPASNNQEILASYTIILEDDNQTSHRGWVATADRNSNLSAEARQRWPISSEEQQQAALDAMAELPVGTQRKRPRGRR